MDREESASVSSGGHGGATSPRKPVNDRVEQMRKRGLPRTSNPSPSPEPQKPSSSRSKTGCITCRRRKKKCDETKPTCKNCEKNNIECEGYSEKTVWRSSKQACTCKTFEKLPLDFTPSSLPSIYGGLDSPVDTTILSHFVQNLSWALTLHNSCSNHFRDIVLPLAFEHQGLMHGILALSGTHLYRTSGQNDHGVLERQHHHFSAALNRLHDEIACQEVRDPTMALIMILVLLSKAEGDVSGTYRLHLSTFRRLVEGDEYGTGGHWVRGDPHFSDFIVEFHRYHEVHALCLITPDRRSRQPSVGTASSEDSNDYASSVHSEAQTKDPQISATIGVNDGLDQLMVRVRALKIRFRNMSSSRKLPAVDFIIKHTGLELEQDIRAWDSGQEKETARWCLAEVYRLACWIDLFHTLHAGQQFIVGTPVANAAASSSSSSSSPLSPPPPSGASLKNSAAQLAKLSSMMQQALDLARHLPQSDPCQSFLLAPVFKVGCSALDTQLRARVTDCLTVIEQHTGMGNVERAREVLQQVWATMDANSETGVFSEAWDADEVMRKMNYDFLIV